MDLAKQLIRSVARAFYETKQILVVDALLIHSALRDDELAHLLGLQTKELRKLCAKLDEHQLLAVHNRQEIREGMQRPISKTYYYINFRQTIDAIKYRIYRLTKEVESMIRPTEERKDYYCPRCKSRWTQMEVLDNPGINGFNCHRCGESLERDDESASDRGGHEIQRKLMQQLDPLLSLLPEIDKVVIPENTFEIALNAAIPPQRNPNTNPTVPMAVVGQSSGGKSMFARDVPQAPAPRLEVDFTSNEEKTAAQQAVEAERKARLAAQNALPVWHTRSTVTGQPMTADVREEAEQKERDRPASARSEDDEAKKAMEANMSDELAQYYAQLAKEQQRVKEEELTSGNEDEEGDDDDKGDGDGEFEDVLAPAPMSNGVKLNLPNGNGTAMSRTASATSGSGASANATASVTAASTPAHVSDHDRPAEDEPQFGAKRRRLQNGEAQYAGAGKEAPAVAAPAPTNPTNPGGITVDINDDDDEEIEFEDV